MIIICLITIAKPCCGNEEKCLESTESEQTEHHEGSIPCESTPCSSFFTCGNCSGFILHTENITEPYPTKFIEQLSSRISSEAEQSGYVTALVKPPIG